MKVNSSTDKFVVVSGVLFVILFVGFFILTPTQTVGESVGFAYFYIIFFITALSLLIKNLVSKERITTKWIKYFAFFSVCLTISPPLYLIVFAAFEPSVDEQCHKVTFELKSSELLRNGQSSFNTSSGSSEGPLSKPRKEENNYIYDISVLTFKERKRSLVIEADNCNAVFLFDIPDMPKPQPFSKWKAPVRFNTSHPYVRLQLRYKIIKN